MDEKKAPTVEVATDAEKCIAAFDAGTYAQFITETGIDCEKAMAQGH